MNITYVSAVVVLVALVGAGAFYGGTVYEKNSLSSQGLLRPSGMMGGNFQRGMGGGVPQDQVQAGQRGTQSGAQGTSGRAGRGGDFVAGEVIAKDAVSITIKTPDGGSKIVYFSDATSIGKSTQGTRDDVAVGSSVVVGGKMGQDGSVVAQNIQIQSAQN